MTSLTGASNYTANFNSTDGVTLDFAGSALTLPQILIDFSRLSTLLLSGAVYGVTPTAAARVRTRIQAVNSVVASYNGGALVEETLTFDTWFEPSKLLVRLTICLSLTLVSQELGSVAQPQIDLGKLGKQDITNPTFGLKVAFRPETLSTNGRLPGGESPRLSPLASDNEGQHDISGSVTQGDQFRVTFTSNVTWATSADIGQIYVDANGDQFRLTAIAGDQSTADFLPLDGTTAPVGGLTDAVAFYEFILPIDYADQAAGTTFAPRFVASGFDQIVADDPRLLLVNDSEWEMKLLLDEAAQRFSDTWLKRDGALSQFDQLLQQSVASADGLSGFMTQDIPLLYGKSFIDLIEDPDASVSFNNLSQVITTHLAALNDYVLNGTPLHFNGTDYNGDLRAYVDDLAQQLSVITGLDTDKLITLEVITGNDVGAGSASTFQELDDTMSADGKLWTKFATALRFKTL